MKQSSRFDRLTSALLPLPLFAVGFLNLLYFVVLQERFDTVRTLFVFGTEGILTLLLLWKCVQLYRQRPDMRKIYHGACGILLVFGALYGWKLLTGGTAFLSAAVTGGCALTACCCTALIVWTEKDGVGFVRAGRVYAVIAVPIAAFYILRFYLPSAAYGVENLGVMDYMTLAYTFLTLALFPLSAQVFFPKEFAASRCRWLDGGLVLLYSVAITLSGTKGTIICLLFCAVLVAAYAGMDKAQKRYVKQYPAIMLASVLLFTTVLFPDYGVPNRLVSFVREGNSVDMDHDAMEQVSQDIANARPSEEPGTTPGEPSDPAGEPGTTPSEPSDPAGEPGTTPVEPSTPSAEPGESIDISAIGDVGSYVSSGEAEQDYLAGRLSAESYEAVQDMFRKINNTATGARKYLLTCSFKEIRSAPLTGHGILSFQSKYGTYPHNLFLEIATDFGLPLTLFVLCLGVYVFLRLLFDLRRDRLRDLFLFYVLTFLPQQMVSGSLYGSGPFFQYGFCILAAFSTCRPLLKGRAAAANPKKEPSCAKTVSTSV